MSENRPHLVPPVVAVAPEAGAFAQSSGSRPESVEAALLEAALEGVQTALKNGDSVAIAGFGTFEVSERAARTGRNPRTGEAIEVKAAKVPKFRPGKALKDAVN